MNMFIKKGRVIPVEEILENEKKLGIPNNLEQLEKPITIEAPTEQDIKENKWYAPRVHLNSAEMYPPLELSQRKHWTNKTAFETCLGNCCGIKGLKGICCVVNPEEIEHVLGPITDDDIEKILKFLNRGGKANFKRQDIIIDFEEGSIMGQNLFNDHPVFKDKKSYPILRMKTIAHFYGCIFLDPESRMCRVYEHRPKMCKSYLCQFVVSNFIVPDTQDPNSPKKWIKIR